MHKKFIGIENKNRALKHHICYNCVESFKHDEEEVTVIPPKHYSYDWMPQFLHHLTEVATIEFHNEYYNKMVHLKSKTKSWQGASFGI